MSALMNIEVEEMLKEETFEDVNESAYDRPNKEGAQTKCGRQHSSELMQRNAHQF
jgi:hypothetical protein